MKTKFVVGNKESYFYLFEDSCVQPFEWNVKTLIVKQVCELFKWAIPRKYLNKNIYGADKIIITDAVFSLSLLLNLKKYYDWDNIYLYYMNVIDEDNIKYINYFNNDNIYTFDKRDSVKYSIKYMHTPYSNKITIKEADIKYDTVFIGREKGRGEEIEQFYRYFCEKGLRPKFMVLDSENSIYKINSYIDYITYINIISKSKSVLEINLPNQTGCTLRYMESLFLGKKLITNNTKIVEDEYYDPNNVFIMGVDSDSDFCEFLNSPNVPVKDLHKVEFNYWLQKFVHEEK